MKKRTLLLVAFLLVAASASASVRISDMNANEVQPKKILKKIPASRPVTLAPAEAETLSKAIAKERGDTEIWLQTSPTSYLAAIARRDFNGRAPLTECFPGER